MLRNIFSLAFRVIALYLRPTSCFRCDNVAFKLVLEGTAYVLHRNIIYNLYYVCRYLDCF
jgi:hypothetical protein